MDDIAGSSAFTRRAVLGASLLGVGAALAQGKADAQSAPPKPQNLVTPAGALELLRAGNRRYVDGVTKRHDFLSERSALESGQNPFAAILSCADSRVAPEYAFDSARGDLFVVRMAGNYLSEDGLASLEYAVSSLGTPLILVLGHDACGAVGAAIKSITQGDVLPGHLPSVVEALRPAVEQARHAQDKLVEATEANVRLTAAKLGRSSDIIENLLRQKRLAIRGGIYRLKSGQVDILA